VAVNRDKHRQSQPEHEQRRQDLADVVGALIDTRQEQKAAAGNQRPEAYQDPRPDAVGEGAEPAREQDRQRGDRQKRKPRLNRAVAADLLQEHRQQKDHASQP
jgi:hypothetical protein